MLRVPSPLIYSYYSGFDIDVPSPFRAVTLRDVVHKMTVAECAVMACVYFLYAAREGWLCSVPRHERRLTYGVLDPFPTSL